MHHFCTTKQLFTQPQDQELFNELETFIALQDFTLSAINYWQYITLLSSFTHRCLTFDLIFQGRAASCSISALCLRPPPCRLAQRPRSLSSSASLWPPVCWCQTPTLSCPTSCPRRPSRRAALSDSSRYIESALIFVHSLALSKVESV